MSGSSEYAHARFCIRIRVAPTAGRPRRQTGRGRGVSDNEIASPLPAQLHTDYLIIGAGAMGMAFADVVFHEQPEAHITLVDRRPRPGGHWNDSYPFVALHQPAAFYGLTSTTLGTGGGDLASGPEIIGYYHRAMQRMLASGRVAFLSQSEYRDDADKGPRVVSLLDASRSTRIEVNQYRVNAGHMSVQIPATHSPGFDVGAGVNLVPINALAQVTRPWRRYVIIGAGKTGIDAILFLLDRGVDPDRIRWIVSNDAWLWNRPSVQPGIATGELLNQMQTLTEHRDVDAVFAALEQQGSMHRICRQTRPTKWRCATVDPGEVDALRRVRDVVRLGRVQSIHTHSIELAQGCIDTGDDHLHVDCTANGLARLAPRAVFAGPEITLQSLIMCQQVFSAAVAAHVALTGLDDDRRNRICRVVPHPEHTTDLPGCVTTSITNLLDWNRHFPVWMRRCRLNLMHHDSLPDYLRLALRARRLLPRAQAAAGPG